MPQNSTLQTDARNWPQSSNTFDLARPWPCGASTGSVQAFLTCWKRLPTSKLLRSIRFDGQDAHFIPPERSELVSIVGIKFVSSW